MKTPEEIQGYEVDVEPTMRDVINDPFRRFNYELLAYRIIHLNPSAKPKDFPWNKAIEAGDTRSIIGAGIESGILYTVGGVLHAGHTLLHTAGQIAGTIFQRR